MVFCNQVESQIDYEILHGNYVICDRPMNIVSAMGAIPKSPNKVRLIHDASRPIGKSLNDYTSDNSCSYMDLSHACKLITKNCFLAKVDLQSAYRSVNIHPSNYRFTGLKWQFTNDSSVTYLYDAKLPFGAAKSPSIFQRLSSCVCRIVKLHYGITAIVYIDDFLVIEKTFEKCMFALQVLVKTLRQLGFCINWNKVEGPCQQLTFLGVRIDTCALTLSLPQDKLEALHELLMTFQSKKRASKRQLESLIGKLNWACQVIQGGRTFLRRVINAKNTLHRQSDKVLLDCFRKDLEWWTAFLPVFNGTVRFLETRPVRSLMTDACNSGGGGYFHGDYFYVNWALGLPEVADKHINAKETLAIILALQRWAPLLSNKKVIVYTDNTTARANINKGASKNTFIMDWLRSLFWTQASYNFSVYAAYVKGKLNTLADVISRLNEPNMLIKLYEMLPFDGSCIVPFTVKALVSHMSPAFIYCRWGRASSSTAHCS